MADPTVNGATQPPMTRARIQVEMDQATQKMLEEMVVLAGAKKTSDVVKQALRLYHWFLVETADGRSVMSVHSDGTRQRPLLV